MGRRMRLVRRIGGTGGVHVCAMCKARKEHLVDYRQMICTHVD